MSIIHVRNVDCSSHELCRYLLQGLKILVTEGEGVLHHPGPLNDGTCKDDSGSTWCKISSIHPLNLDPKPFTVCRTQNCGVASRHYLLVTMSWFKSLEAIHVSGFRDLGLRVCGALCTWKLHVFPFVGLSYAFIGSIRKQGRTSRVQVG